MTTAEQLERAREHLVHALDLIGPAVKELGTAPLADALRMAAADIDDGTRRIDRVRAHLRVRRQG